MEVLVCSANSHMIEVGMISDHFIITIIVYSSGSVTSAGMMTV